MAALKLIAIVPIADLTEVTILSTEFYSVAALKLQCDPHNNCWVFPLSTEFYSVAALKRRVVHVEWLNWGLVGGWVEAYWVATAAAGEPAGGVRIIESG